MCVCVCVILRWLAKLGLICIIRNFGLLLSEIHEANWLTLPEDLGSDHVGRYDAVLCLGNSFAHMPDADGNLTLQKNGSAVF